MVVRARRKAHNADLGGVLASTRVSCISGWLLFAAGMVLLAGWATMAAIAIVALSNAVPTASMLAAIVGAETLICVPFGVLLLRFGWRRRAIELVVHESAIVHRDKRGTSVFALGEIAHVFETLDEIDTPIGARLDVKVTLEMKDGRRIVIDRSLRNHAEVARAAAIVAQDTILPNAEMAIASGHHVRFGPITLDSACVRTADCTLPWTSIAFVRWERVVYRGSYTLHLPDGSVAARIPSEHVPNPRVLLALLEQFGKLERAKEEIVADVLGVAGAAA
jgi:hypothetical protein